MPDQHLPIYANPPQEASPDRQKSGNRPVTAKKLLGLHNAGFRPLTVIPPNAAIAKASAGAGVTAGKTPGRYDLRDGAWTGIRAWSRKTLYKYYGAWTVCPHDQPPNVGLRTDDLIAFDVDTEDAQIADAIEREALAFFPDAPVRWRANSEKRLILFRVDPADPLLKPIAIKFHHPTHGAVGLDILTGSGKFFVAAGTHPSGARIQWRNGRPTSFKHVNDLPPMPASVLELFLIPLFIEMHERKGYRLKSRPAGGANPHSKTAAIPIGSTELLAPSPTRLKRTLNALRNDGAFDARIDAINLIRAVKAAAGGKPAILPALIAWAERWHCDHETEAKHWVETRWAAIHDSEFGWNYIQGKKFAQDRADEKPLTDKDFDALLG